MTELMWCGLGKVRSKLSLGRVMSEKILAFETSGLLFPWDLLPHHEAPHSPRAWQCDLCWAAHMLLATTSHIEPGLDHTLPGPLLMARPWYLCSQVFWKAEIFSHFLHIVAALHPWRCTLWLVLGEEASYYLQSLCGRVTKALTLDTSMFTCTYTHINIYTHTDRCTHMYTYTYTYMYTYIHTCIVVMVNLGSQCDWI
jgi:hypothetical protein